MRKNRESKKLVVKEKGNFPTRYKGSSPDLDMKKKQSSAYKSRYTSSLSPEKEIDVSVKSSFKTRY